MKPAGDRYSAAPKSFRAIPIGGIIYYSMSIFTATTAPASGPAIRPAGPVWWQRSSKSSDTLMPRATWKAGGLLRLISSRLGTGRKPLVRLRHKPNGDPAYAVISDKNSQPFNLSNAAPLLGF